MNKTNALPPTDIQSVNVITVSVIGFIHFIWSALKRVGVGDDPTSYWSLKQISASTVLDIVSLLS